MRRTISSDEIIDNEKESKTAKLPVGLVVSMCIVVIILAVVIGFEVVYYGRVLPGVIADGVNVSGMSQAAAADAITHHTQSYQTKSFTLNYDGKPTVVKTSSLALSYNPDTTATIALGFGHSGSLIDQLHAQLRSFFGKQTPVSDVQYDAAALADYTGTITDSVDTTVSDAQLGVNGTQISIVPAVYGNRVDIGALTNAVINQISGTKTSDIILSSYKINPSIDTTGATEAAPQAENYLLSPLNLTYAGRSTQVPLSTIATWLTLTAEPQQTPLIDLYPVPSKVRVDLNQGAVAAYVSTIAANVDRAPQNAVLTMTNGQPTAAIPSSNGQSLDQSSAVTLIASALASSSTTKAVTLAVATIPPAVTSTNLESLGINTLISEGATTFSGSGYNRDTNIRIAASRFNNVLIAPGATFSFGAQLGDVGPAQGYKPGYVILGNHEQLQYGGGICQVGTTAFRAALLAGLPIVERHPHSFAVSFYTAPYGVPGVDATIYYPQDDLKFTNDTGAYILIQTIMQGESLKFDFYGTKTKSGVIRGPFFISGSNNAAQSSQTVFYRDVLDNSGALIKTDTINSNYAPSTNFPIISGAILN